MGVIYSLDAIAAAYVYVRGFRQLRIEGGYRREGRKDSLRPDTGVLACGHDVGGGACSNKFRCQNGVYVEVITPPLFSWLVSGFDWTK